MRRVRIIFKTHLDIGFTDLAVRVVERYFRDFIVQAVKTAEYFRRGSGAFRYRWTVGSWLIDEYFNRATEAERRFLEQAIADGDIVWHAMPFTTHTELLTRELLRDGLAISGELDRRFGRRTRAAKLTDVPGHTRGLIGPFTDAGVDFLHIGTNPAAGVCKVPPLFRWKDSRNREILVAYQPRYGELLTIPGSDQSFLVCVTGDNTGPHTPEMVEQLFAELSESVPGARFESATFDDLAEALRPIASTLPLVEEELGDTWIHGAGSDPLKTAGLRELARFRRGSATARSCAPFLRGLLLAAEHTWGMDEKIHLHDRSSWSANAVRALVQTPEGARFASSWREQRDYLSRAVAALPEPDRTEALRRLHTLRPHPAEAFEPLEGTRFENDAFALEFDPASGTVCRLRRKTDGREFAAPDAPLFLFRMESFGNPEIHRFLDRYLRSRQDWALADFGKPGLPDSVQAQRNDGFPATLSIRHDPEGSRLLLSGAPAPFPGGVRRVETELFLPHNRPEIEAELRFFGKEPARSPHAFWVRIRPECGPELKISFTKLGEPIDPRRVVPGGARTLHAVDGTIQFAGEAGCCTLETLDAPLFAPGEPALFDFPDTLPEFRRGGWINLYNNVWGTNFPMWFSDDMRYRFRLRFPVPAR